ncbi:MAG TPA: TonB family protein [Polyangia bacterium]|nr:TonB family protein [Polyangia bacterium]
MTGSIFPRPQPAAPAMPRRQPRRHDNPFVEKRNRQRQFAQVRAMAHVRVPLSSDFRAHRGLHRMPSWLRAAVGILVLLVSVGLHVAFVITAFGISRLSHQNSVARQQVAIEVREREAKPKEPPPPKEPEPEVKPERAIPLRQAPQPKVEAQPKEPPKAQPARVVGLSFESTVGDGAGEGEGPAFGVGNTRMGETAKTAAPPKEVPKQTINNGPTTVKPVANAVATRIPVAGVVFAQAKRKKEVKPEFPPTLKTQGIEGDVPVIVWIDEKGKVTSVKILKESPYPEFNEAAKKAALADEFEPATRNGVPTATTLKYNVSFRLVD